jgi:hypothetical protein
LYGIFGSPVLLDGSATGRRERRPAGRQQVKEASDEERSSRSVTRLLWKSAIGLKRQAKPSFQDDFANVRPEALFA